MLIALTLGAALLATPASAAGVHTPAEIGHHSPLSSTDARPVTAGAVGTTASLHGSVSSTHHKTADHKKLAKDKDKDKKKKKKKKGFFRKLGAALLVVLILGVLFVVALIVLVIFLIRRASRRRRS
ncbi:hypothetical protein [Streptomyces netropsis]|uniref:Cobalamin biosynthesis Mg chelatase CobN n=1 Tax=Streptomyces netropsis TaxID=55404 RepID=A0A7W7PFV0_STRNE|nr:hypothetical protein [Streptomyces netropsis]MBB4888152.1 cobalamin biosynthesis Mg chelatase CobN [Streptomyces netropsis]GGR31660.1 hypothetical protein GCM10010219_40500 [Streptomyces netropsis]